MKKGWKFPAPTFFFVLLPFAFDLFFLYLILCKNDFILRHTAAR